MRYYLKTYGCQMNVSDSERITSVLESLNFKEVPEKKKADLVIINVCSVRQSAIDRVYGLIRNLAKLNKKIILTGCILPIDKKKLKDKVDLIFEIKDLPKLPDKLTKIFRLNRFSGISFSKFYLTIAPKHQSFSYAYVPISTGCDNFCSYCVVPYTRGKENYRPAKEIISEVKKLIKRGYKEIILLGQNVNSYYSFIKIKKINFPKLLKILNDIPGNFYLQFLTSHPKDVSNELIETIAKCDKIRKSLHLPIQSGDNEILKKMNRGYTKEKYKELVGKIRKKIPNISISTDIIVGFPEETKKQFENTVKLCKEIKFDKAYIAQYSSRFGTAASRLKDNVSLKEKKQRWKILDDLINKK